MWGFIDEYINYIKVGLAVLAACVCFYGGFHIGNGRYLAYKFEVEATAKAHEEHDKDVEKERNILNEGIKNEFEGKLAALRNYYGGVHINPGSRSVPGISPTPKGADAETAYPILAGQCAETTLQVNLWQEWATENGLIK